MISSLTRLLAACVAAATLASCGGTDNGGIFLSTVQASPTQYSKTTLIAVSGIGFNKGIQVVADSGCGDITEVAGGDNQTRRYTCKVNALGDMVVRVLTSDGLQLGKLSLSIPPPEVTITFNGLDSSNLQATQQMVLRLDPVKAPATVDNFLSYVNSGFYSKLIFHRIAKDFVVQTGGYTAPAAGSTSPVKKAATQPPITLESNNGLSNVHGSVAMARTSEPNSATTEFFINTADNSAALDYKDANSPGYAVFGSLIQGLDVLDLLNAVSTQSSPVLGGEQSYPISAITITSAVQTK